MADNKWIHIDNWMGKILGLKANELLCFAVIYGFTRDGMTEYKCNLSYLASTIFATKQTTFTVLKKLVEHNLILKREEMISGIKYCFYQTNIIYDEGKIYKVDPIKEPLIAIKESLTATIKESLTQYTNNKNKDNNINKKRLSNDNPKDELFEKFWADYGRKGTKANALKEWNKLKDKEIELIIDHLQEYLIYCKRSNRPKKDASTYLHQKCFNENWNIVPEYYQSNEQDDERLANFKKYICINFPDLIYHRNPLTFEQADDLFKNYEIEKVEEAMRKLSKRYIHQYYNVLDGIKDVLSELDED